MNDKVLEYIFECFGEKKVLRGDWTVFLYLLRESKRRYWSRHFLVTQLDIMEETKLSKKTVTTSLRRLEMQNLISFRTKGGTGTYIDLWIPYG